MEKDGVTIFHMILFFFSAKKNLSKNYYLFLYKLIVFTNINYIINSGNPL